MDYVLTGNQPPQRVSRAIKMHGLCVLKGFYATAEMQTIEEAVREYLKHPGPAVIDEPYLQTYRAFPEDIRTSLQRLFYRNQYFAEVARSFVRERYFFPAKCYITVTKPGTDKNRLPYAMHFDEVQWLKFFLQITDVRKYGGAIEIAPNTHIENRQYREAQIGRGCSYDQIETVCGGEPEPILTAPGDLIIFDTDTSHNAGADGDRLAIQVLGATQRVIKWRGYENGFDAVDPLRKGRAGQIQKDVEEE